MKTKKKIKTDKIPRQYSLVKVSEEWLRLIEDTQYTNDALYKEAKKYNCFVFLGDIPNMTWHCVVISVKSGKVFSCYHTEDFEELSEDEV